MTSITAAATAETKGGREKTSEPESIPLVDLKANYAAIQDEVNASMAEVRMATQSATLCSGGLLSAVQCL